MTRNCLGCQGSGRRKDNLDRWISCPNCVGTGWITYNPIDLSRGDRPHWMDPQTRTSYSHVLARHWRPILFLSIFGPLAIVLWRVANHLLINLVGKP